MKTTWGQGRYEVLRKIGEGGSSEVFEVLDTRLNVTRALKSMVLSARPDVRVRQEREALLMARLLHPSIVSVFDSFVEDGYQCVVMELCVCSLEDHVNLEDGVVDVATLLLWAQQTATALALAHSQGILHRDIKPQNLLISSDHRCTISDFGIGCMSDDPNSLTHTGAVLGTVPYMSPDIRRGLPHSPASDRYALAASFVFASTKRIPADLDRMGAWEGVPTELSEFLQALIQQPSPFPDEESSADLGEVAQGSYGTPSWPTPSWPTPSEPVRIGETPAPPPAVPPPPNPPEAASSSSLPWALLVGVVASVVLLGVMGETSGDGQVLPRVGLPTQTPSDPITAYATLPVCEPDLRFEVVDRYPRFDLDPTLPREGSGAALGDFDGDGDLDLAIGYSLGNAVEVYTNQGGVLFPRDNDDEPLQVPQKVRVSIGHRTLTSGRLNGDEKADLIWEKRNRMGFQLLRWQDDPLKMPEDWPFPEPIARPVLWDLGGDGCDDILFVQFKAGTDLMVSEVRCDGRDTTERTLRKGVSAVQRVGAFLLIDDAERGVSRFDPQTNTVTSIETPALPLSLENHLAVADLPAGVALPLGLTEDGEVCRDANALPPGFESARGDIDGDGIDDRVAVSTCGFCTSQIVVERGVRSP